MYGELTKTSLLIIATIFTGIGAAILQTDMIKGTIMLLAAVGILALRGYLKKKGYDIEKKKEDSV